MSDLQSQVDHIARTITEWDANAVNDDGEPLSAFDYLEDALDIEYTVSSRHEYLGARVLVTFGGPNIWINTRTNIVEGFWSGDEAWSVYDDNMGLDDALRELYESCKA